MVGARAVEMITAAAHAGTSTIQHAITHLPPSGRRQATAAENAVLSHHNQCESRGRGPRWLVRLDHVADVLAKYPDTAAGVAALRHPMNSQTYCTHTYTLSLTPPPPQRSPAPLRTQAPRASAASTMPLALAPCSSPCHLLLTASAC